jgi:predicted AlkP superfamily pyrophosphatase or phosphodiesterase
MRSTASLVLVLVLIAGTGAVAALRTRPASPTDPPRPKLAVLVVFDQMRGDYPARWQHLYTAGGFRRLTTDGAWFTQCNYPYGVTTTGPGHASMLTGTCPDRHGIVNNNWNENGKDIYCAASDRYRIYPAVTPAIDPKTGKPAKPPLGGNPDKLLSETVADVLKRTHGDSCRVFGLSLKDRSAILPTGKNPDGAYWFDGRFVTSSYYTEVVGRPFPDWVRLFANPNYADRWFGKDWSRFRPDLDYARWSADDETRGEGGGKQGRGFPHPMTGGLNKPGKEYYDAVANSPYGNELLLTFAKECIGREHLGQHAAPDLLVISFSSNDLVGHTWGPDSQEVLDITLRTDAVIADLMRFLDARVGKDAYLLAVTADHGIGPLPEVSQARGRDARRVSRTVLQDRAERFLRDRFSDVELPAKTNWIEAFSFPWIYLNPKIVAKSGRSREVVNGTLARFLNSQADIGRAFSREELAAKVPPRDELHRLMKRSFIPSRCGDVCVVLRPLDLPGDLKANETLKLETGTTHGSPYEYDTHVPLIVYGPGIRGGIRTEPVTPQATAAIFADYLRLPPPRHAEYPVPRTLK